MIGVGDAGQNERNNLYLSHWAIFSLHNKFLPIGSQGTQGFPLPSRMGLVEKSSNLLSCTPFIPDFMCGNKERFIKRSSNSLLVTNRVCWNNYYQAVGSSRMVYS